MTHAFITPPETPYHMHGGLSAKSRWTYAACGKVDHGEILNCIEFEGLLDGSPSWCCSDCVKEYQKTVDALIARRKRTTL